MRLRLGWVVALLLSAAALSFLTGYRLRGARTLAPSVSAGRRVLYYVDPMNPSFRSREPGTAPCGMPLEPVYADSPGAADGGGASSAANVPVRADRQQLIGVTLGKAERRTVRQSLRLLGRVAVDEKRLFKLSSVSEGWVREVGQATTGSIVSKGDILATFYTPEISSKQQTLLSTLNTYERVKQTGVNPYDNLQGGTQLQAYENNLRLLRQSLMNLGMSAEQIEEIEEGRKVAPVMQIRAPASGFVLSRNVSVGQRFEGGAELYTIADLSHVWVLADVFEADAGLVRPRARCSVTRPGAGGTLAGRVSEVLPQFDPATRTLKVRLEVENRGFTLRPDMFVDVEMPVELGPALVVPKEAVLDSGTRRAVFVAKGEGLFEPRPVTIGWRQGEMVEILSGLADGEAVVTSGNFLLDSESRMRAAGAVGAGDAQSPPAMARQASAGKDSRPADSGDTAVDPICGMQVSKAKAAAEGLVSAHAGRTHYFCGASCKKSFDRDPAAPGKKS